MPHFRFGLASLNRRPVAGYALGAVLTALSLAIRLVLAPWMPPGFPYVTFFPAVILTTYVAGRGPGIAAAIACGVAAWYFFIPPVGAFALTVGAGLAMGFYTVVVAVDIAIIHIMSNALIRLDEERHRSAELSRQAQVMFSELQHRVSNNLQLVSSLLLIQAAKVSDADAARALEDARTRVATLSRLHRMLHNPAEQDLDMGEYLRELCRDIIDATGASHVAWTVTAEPVRIRHDRLVPTALIVTELLSNALEHGFPDGRPGRISVALQPTAGGDGFCLAVRDDGAGLPPAFRLEEQTSLGLRIVRSLAAQIGGRITMESDNGTVCTLCVA